MKRLFAFLLALMLIVGCFAGCSRKDDSPGSGLEPMDDSNAGLALEENGVVYASLAQKAVVKTALAYLARGARVQYDSSRMNKDDGSNGTLYRWQSGVRKSPEEYTAQYPGYTNATAFVAEVYLSALNCTVAADDLADATGECLAYRYTPTDEETEEEKVAVASAFFDALQMGDIIVIRRHNGTDHAMLYVGSKVLEGVAGDRGAAAEHPDESGLPNDSGYIYDLIHSAGYSYDYELAADRFEPNGGVQIAAANSMFDSRSDSYLFGKLADLTVIRPLNAFAGEVPENSKNRMLHMDNVIAEKLSSLVTGNTVNPGENITYWISVTNQNDTPVTLEVLDAVPENTTLVSVEGGKVDGVNLRWSLSVPAGATATASFVVCVNEDAQPGIFVEGTAGSVGGVSVQCPGVYVGRTLAAGEKNALLGDIDTQLANGLKGMELANALYNTALQNVNLLREDLKTVLATAFQPVGNRYCLAWEGMYKDMVAPGMFGGQGVRQRDPSVPENMLQRQENKRARVVKLENLMVGDLVMAADDAAGEVRKLYMVTDTGMLNLLTGTKLTSDASEDMLMSLFSTNRFAVLRPSLLLGTD